MSQAYLGLGSNLGDSFNTMQAAVNALNAVQGIRVVSVAPVYVSSPMGGIATGQFLNTVVQIDTTIQPDALLSCIKELEVALGRNPRARWDSREIDIDLLIYDDLVLTTPALSLPHPGILSRDFVLIPLCDIAPDLIHPVTMKKISEISVPETGIFVSGTHPQQLAIK